MTLLNSYESCDADYIDEEFFGPAPRFLRERPRAANDDTADIRDTTPERARQHPLRAFRGWLRRLIA